MKNILLITLTIILLFSTFSLDIYAAEIEEPTEVIETTESEEPTEVIETNNIENLLTMILFTNIFMIFIHFSEKWLKIGLNLNKESGRVS